MVTLPPVKLPDISRDGRSGPYSGQDTGCGHPWLFEYQGPQRLYVVTWSFIDTNLPDFPRVRIYKSTDGGLSWALQDAANSPEMAQQTFDVAQDGNTLHVIYRQSSNSLPVVRPFDVSTDTWGAASADGPDVSDGSAGGQTAFKMIRRNSGDFWVFWNFGTSSTNEWTKYAVLSAGVWGATQTFTAEVAFFRKPFSRLIYESGPDLIHVISFSAPDGASVTWSILHQTINAAGVISAPDTVGSVGLSPAGVVPAITPNIGRPLIWNGFIVVPETYFRTTFPASNRQVKVFMGTPVAAPVWSANLINTLSLPANEQDYESYAFVSNDGLTLYVAWVFMNGTAGTVEQLYIASTQDGTTWTAPVLFYDAIANPQASPSPTGNYIHAISLLEFAATAGRFAAVCALQTDDFSVSDCLGYFLIDEGGSTPLSITCDDPPAGEVGVAYDHTFPVEGGTPPYSFAITAGALPDGLNLDAATGEITGVPTLAGTFPFTVEVTDSDLNTADVECSITISEMTIGCGDPPNGKVNVPYTHSFPVEGGVAPLTFAITAGALPSGLTLEAADGTVEGTPAAAGLSTFTVEVTDSADNVASVECSIRVCPMNAKGA